MCGGKKFPQKRLGGQLKKLGGQKLNSRHLAVVVERSRALYLIDILVMLKVEGLNPGAAVLFL